MRMRRHCSALADLPDTRGRRRSSFPYALAGSNRGAAGGDSHFVGILLLGAAANCYSSRRSRISDLRRGADTCDLRGHAGRWTAAVASTQLGGSWASGAPVLRYSSSSSSSSPARRVTDVPAFRNACRYSSRRSKCAASERRSCRLSLTVKM